MPQVTVILASLSCDDAALDSYFRSLDADERNRAESFADETIRRRYVAGRGLLRALLARQLNCPPAAVEFETGVQGKPCLSCDHPLKFNLAHSGDRIAVAVARGLDVGIDIERRRPEISGDLDAIIGHAFEGEERKRLARIDPALREADFYRRWTRREAVLKAKGFGFAQRGAAQPADDFAVRELALDTGWFGAVAAKAGGFRLSVRHGFRGVWPV